MNTAAHKIAAMIKRADPDGTHSIEVMQYALAILLNTMVIIAVSLLFGWLGHHLEQTCIAFCSLAVLRMVSGGSHLKSAWLCNIVSIALCAGIPLAAPCIPSSFLFLMNAVCLVMMLLFSPRPDANATIPGNLYPALKGVSILVVSLNFVLSSPTIGLAFLIQSLTIVPLGREVKI